mmetsp:Transcript_34201/g.43928  ORF Transcript_34201/g.43928 Transcript_34201/m.43928 type:complete len:81 (-) Transcript_34201:110-352(-)
MYSSELYAMPSLSYQLAHFSLIMLDIQKVQFHLEKTFSKMKLQFPTSQIIHLSLQSCMQGFFLRFLCVIVLSPDHCHFKI